MIIKQRDVNANMTADSYIFQKGMCGSIYGLTGVRLSTGLSCSFFTEKKNSPYSLKNHLPVPFPLGVKEM